jgi:hypothetical protein
MNLTGLLLLTGPFGNMKWASPPTLGRGSQTARAMQEPRP